MIEEAVDADGVMTITWNTAGDGLNVMNGTSIKAFGAAIGRAITNQAAKAVIITSSRPEFIVGADLYELLALPDAAAAFALSQHLNRLFREIERAKKPIVAAINGSALGGGFELCLACHRRIASENPKTQVGLPEVTLGVLPAAGGTQRLPRMIGIAAALPLLMEGQKLDLAKAAELGLVDEIVPGPTLLARAKAWALAAKPEDLVKAWDRKRFRLPGGPVQSQSSWQLFMVGAGLLQEKTRGLYPAPGVIMSAVYDGCHVDLDTGLKIEGRRFATLATSPESKNMIKTLFFAIGAANKLSGRVADVPVQVYRTIGVLGAGMMGAGIAYVSAEAGMTVMLLDRDIDAAEKGKAHTARLLDKRVKSGRLTPQGRQAILDRIVATTDYAQLGNAELVIEAVFENREIKAQVTRSAEAAMSANGIFASNTSTLPITGLAEISVRPANFVGLHFFSPVDRMPLVEVIRGKGTSEATIARAMDYVKAIRKTPIVVNDGRAFYTSRVFGTYPYEGMALLRDGVAPALIENAGKQAGMPVGPLAVLDEVSIELMHKVFRQTEADLGAAYLPQPQDSVLIAMVETLKRPGRHAGQGFYEYRHDGSKRLWPGLAEHFPLAAEQPSIEEVKMRLMFIQSIEAARCLEEGIVASEQDADVGSILGWNFPAALGGVSSQIETVGPERFVAECDRMAALYGPRFRPPAYLRTRLAAGAAKRAA